MTSRRPQNFLHLSDARQLVGLSDQCLVVCQRDVVARAGPRRERHRFAVVGSGSKLSLIAKSLPMRRLASLVETPRIVWATFCLCVGSWKRTDRWMRTSSLNRRSYARISKRGVDAILSRVEFCELSYNEPAKFINSLTAQRRKK